MKVDCKILHPTKWRKELLKKNIDSQAFKKNIAFEVQDHFSCESRAFGPYLFLAHISYRNQFFLSESLTLVFRYAFCKWTDKFCKMERFQTARIPL